MKWPRLSERANERIEFYSRFIVLLPMFVLGKQLYGFAHEAWGEHWLRKDGKPVEALVVQVGPKRAIDYQYKVDGKEFTGHGVRDWEDERDHELKVGEQTRVNVSASHPWISSPSLSHSVWLASPIVLAILVFEFGLLTILFRPRGGWSGKSWVLIIRKERRY